MRMMIGALVAYAALTAPALAEVAVKEVAFAPELSARFEEKYGAREADTLRRLVSESLRREFASRGIEAGAIAVTVEDAKPNRPTFKELTDRPGLDYFRSISIGGAELRGEVFAASGASLGEVRTRWYETDIRQISAAGTWGDARRAVSRFADRVADRLQAGTPAVGAGEAGA